MIVPGFSSTGSKRPDALFGRWPGPTAFVRSRGCRVWDADGNEYLDTIMALGAVALGYAHPEVVDAAEAAMRGGTVGPLPPTLEHEVAEQLVALYPGAEAVRFFKTGAEAVAAAVRTARVHTGRERVITCGYHGWLDWCQDVPGVPEAVTGLRHEVPFNDREALASALDAFGPVAAIVIEPVVDAAPDVEWLTEARRLASRTGAVLVFDEIKTALRIAVGGAAERYGITPDLATLGKAMGNGFPIAALVGAGGVMGAISRTWVSSTLATECVGLAAAGAVIGLYQREAVVQHLADVGARLMSGLAALAETHGSIITGTGGVPEMCYLQFREEPRAAELASRAAARGLLFKRNAYNFVSLAHSEAIIDRVLEHLDQVLDEMERTC